MVKKKVIKKVVTLLLALSVVLGLGITATACGDKNSPPHECTWETTLTKDDTHHWYKCTDDTCTKIKDKVEHEFVDGVCACGQEDPNYTNPDGSEDGLQVRPPQKPNKEDSYEAK